MSMLDAHIPQIVASESAFGAKAALMREGVPVFGVGEQEGFLEGRPAHDDLADGQRRRQVAGQLVLGISTARAPATLPRRLRRRAATVMAHDSVSADAASSTSSPSAWSAPAGGKSVSAVQ